jgi:ribonuclease HI
MPASAKTITIYTDGACSGNPGPGGWAALLRYEAGEQRAERELSGFEPDTTNNRMELRAVVEALAALKEPVRALVHTDSAYVANAFNQGWIANWQRRGWRTAGKTPVKNRDLWEALLAQTQRHDVTFVKVKGHADDALNNHVDGLAVRAMRDHMEAAS